MHCSRILPLHRVTVVTVAMPHKLSSKMADSAASASNCLNHIPENISIKFLPNSQNVCDSIKRRALNFYTQGYIHKIKVFDNFLPKVTVTAKCWRLMRKSEKPHDLHLDINETCQQKTESYCTCQVG
ncbi:hypothetical protein DPMN_175682 [Dreissena polymorpha]|uniref:Uncharacterized protein n=1 Tax=Dreissena polymorpha TaxID=45954 RepID=A0A9D4IJV2_DREPO|nr:hypothetical protein DPMN_175682 [Dreissena polymorpha]